MTFSGNPMVEAQEAYDDEISTPFNEELQTLEEDLKIAEQWSLIHENALIDLEDRQVELPVNVYKHLKQVLSDKYDIQQDLIMEKRQAIENHLSTSEYEE